MLERRGKKRHSALYKQLVGEYTSMGYTLREAMELVSEGLSINEMYEDYDDTGSDDDFQRTYCHIRWKEEGDE